MMTDGEERFWHVRMWLVQQHSCMAELAREMGITHAATRKLLMAETIPPLRHHQLMDLGVPVEFLAPAVKKRASDTASTKKRLGD